MYFKAEPAPKINFSHLKNMGLFEPPFVKDLIQKISDFISMFPKTLTID